MKSPQEPAIIVKNVTKSFRIPLDKSNGIKQVVVNSFKRQKGYREFNALNGVSFEVKKGEFFGIVGRNGSGKSTMLKILAGVYSPDSGGVAVNGTLTPFIELGVGFNPELTGRENVFLNGALLGFSRREMERMYDDIVDFAELHEFMEERLKNYSSGMQVRLAFSIAIRADTDILVLDEVLAVGDDLFQKKCFDYFAKLKRTKKTVILVSHDKSSLERFCERAILIDGGKVVQVGPTSQVINTYSRLLSDSMSSTASNDHDDEVIKDTRIDKARIGKVTTFDDMGDARINFISNQSIIVSFEIEFLSEVTHPVIGVTVWQKDIVKPVLATNTTVQAIKTGQYEPGDVIRFDLTLPKLLNDGEYSIEPAIADEWTTVFFDRIPGAAHFAISGGNNLYSILSGSERIHLTKSRRHHGKA